MNPRLNHNKKIKASFQMTCSCGDTMKVDAASRDEAVSKLKAMMDEKSIAVHMKEKHPGDPVISVADCHQQIEAQVVAL